MVCFHLLKYPALVAIGIVSAISNEIQQFGEGAIAVGTEESMSHKAEIIGLSTDGKVTHDAGVLPGSLLA